MRVTFLGTGTSQGVPIITCECAVCSSGNAKDKRLRTSVHIQFDEMSLVVDTGPDFRYQMLRAGIKQLDGVLITHQHRDHIAGLDDVRCYNYKQQKPMPVYANAYVMDQLKREYHYAFDNKYPGVPQLELHLIENKKFSIGSMIITPIQVIHHQMPVFGYRFGDFTYITDANYIPEEEISKLEGTKTLVINALQHDDHISHFNLNEALDMIDRIGPDRAYLTHISHKLGLYDEINRTLPENVFLAYDGLTIEA